MSAILDCFPQDGANPQAVAVLAYVKWLIGDGIYKGDHKANITVGRWENMREQGYVLMLRIPYKAEQLNIAFFEHRNSDSICAVKWEQYTLNSPTIDTAEFGDVYKNKYDLSHQVTAGQAYDMAEWIVSELKNYFDEKWDVK